MKQHRMDLFAGSGRVGNLCSNLTANHEIDLQWP